MGGIYLIYTVSGKIVFMEDKEAKRQKLLDDLDYVSSWPMELVHKADFSSQEGGDAYQKSLKEEINRRYQERFGDVENQDVMEIIRSRVRRNKSTRDTDPIKGRRFYTPTGTPMNPPREEIAQNNEPVSRYPASIPRGSSELLDMINMLNNLK